MMNRLITSCQCFNQKKKKSINYARWNYLPHKWVSSTYSMWLAQDQQPIQKKGNGCVIHVSDFISKTIGQIKLSEEQIANQYKQAAKDWLSAFKACKIKARLANFLKEKVVAWNRGRNCENSVMCDSENKPNYLPNTLFTNFYAARELIYRHHTFWQSVTACERLSAWVIMMIVIRRTLVYYLISTTWNDPRRAPTPHNSCWGDYHDYNNCLLSYYRLGRSLAFHKTCNTHLKAHWTTMDPRASIWARR